MQPESRSNLISHETVRADNPVFAAISLCVIFELSTIVLRIKLYFHGCLMPVEDKLGIVRLSPRRTITAAALAAAAAIAVPTAASATTVSPDIPADLCAGRVDSDTLKLT